MVLEFQGSRILGLGAFIEGLLGLFLRGFKGVSPQRSGSES